MRSIVRLLLLAVPFTFLAFSQNCSLTLNSQNVLASAAGGSSTVKVTLSNPACLWYVSGGSDSPWITQTSPTIGVFGDGDIKFTTSANTGSGRNGSVNVVLFGNPPIKYQVQVQQPGSTSTQPFADVLPANPYFDFASIIKTAGVTRGCSLTPTVKFCPDDNLTRAQAAASIIRAIVTEPFIYTRTPYFDDVPATHPFFSYIQKMKDLGITGGCSATPALFCPETPITRLQMATFLIRGRFGATAILNNSKVPYFTDVPADSVGFPFIQKMKDYGVTNGCGPTSYCPDGTVNRGSMAVFMTRLYLTNFLF